MAEITEIDKDLNLVIHLEKDKTLYCPPLPLKVFRSLYRPLALVWAQLANDGMIGITGQAIAYYALKDKLSQKETDAVESELRSSATILSPSENGFSEMLLNQAIGKGILSEKEKDEVLNSLVYFIAASAMEKGQRQKEILKLMLQGNSELTSQVFMDFKGSLETSKKAPSGQETT